MRTRLISTIFLLSLCASVPAQVMGSVLPSGALRGLSNTPAKTFADYEGRCVLIEFFAYW